MFITEKKKLFNAWHVIRKLNDSVKQSGHCSGPDKLRYWHLSTNATVNEKFIDEVANTGNTRMPSKPVSKAQVLHVRDSDASDFGPKNPRKDLSPSSIRYNLKICARVSRQLRHVQPDSRT